MIPNLMRAVLCLAVLILAGARNAGAQPSVLVPTASGTYGATPGEDFLFFKPPAGVAYRGTIVFHPGIGAGPSQLITLSNVNHLAELLLVNGVSILAIGTPPVTTGQVWPTQLNSAARAVQFLRVNAAAFGVDGTRVAVWGISYGAFLMGVLAYGPDHQKPNGTLLEQQSSRPLAFLNQRGPSSFVIMADSFYGGWFGKNTLGEVSPQVRADASFADLVFANAANRSYTPPAVSYYNDAGVGWPSATPPTNPHDKAFLTYFAQALAAFAFLAQQPLVAEQSFALLNPNQYPILDTTDNEVLIGHVMRWFAAPQALSLGYSKAGAAGIPGLAINGVVKSGATVELVAKSGMAQATTAIMAMGVNKVFHIMPCQGVLVPSLDITLAVPIGASGTLTLPVNVPANLPVGSSLFMQFFLADPAAPCGYAESNAIKVSVE